jgi:hypothetical protein
MMIFIISMEHPWQVVESDSDGEELLENKWELDRHLRKEIGARVIEAICEEASRTKESIAHRLSIEYQLPWHNIDMDEDERRAAGIREALRNRPSSPDDKHDPTIDVRIPAEVIREDHFVEQILQECHDKDNVLVLLGDLHVEATAEKYGRVATMSLSMLLQSLWRDGQHSFYAELVGCLTGLEKSRGREGEAAQASGLVGSDS